MQIDAKFKIEKFSKNSLKKLTDFFQFINGRVNDGKKNISTTCICGKNRIRSKKTVIEGNILNAVYNCIIYSTQLLIGSHSTKRGGVGFVDTYILAAILVEALGCCIWPTQLWNQQVPATCRFLVGASKGIMRGLTTREKVIVKNICIFLTKKLKFASL